ncbi:MAG: NAD-dependent epimerase/dehydratase family protein [Lentisphaerae bacterium]|nr:NAD-dependent epimerase/dehydratase family protein [Lentisphaerota bacterium]
MRCLVTGGAGFIGSNLAERLVREGAAVRVLDDFSTGRDENLRGWSGRADVIRGSILDRDLLAAAVAGVDWVFHLAAWPSVEASVRDPEGSAEVNTGGTMAVLAAAEKAKVRGLVFSSTCAVYGNSTAFPLGEEVAPDPLSPYAIQKLAGEHYCGFHARTRGLRAFILRYFNVYGPRQDPGSSYGAAIPRFVTAMAKGRQPTIFGDGLQTRDFVFVGDVVDANVRCMDAGDGAIGTAMNIASGVSCSVLDLAGAIAGMTGVDLRPEMAPARKGEVRDSLGDASKAGRLIGWTAKTGLKDGLAPTIEHFREAAT